ncbi:MAG: NAD-glutamate dehydrogenase, partial [Rhodoferax sp.]
MTIAPLAELLNYTQEHAGPAASKQTDFVAAYFENTDPDEIATRGPATLFAIANAHWRLLDTPHVAQSAKVRVFNPTLAEDGFVSDHTVVQIVHDNMPFLVDSVTMAINRGNRTAHWIVHPLMSVARDPQGKITSVSSVAAATSAGQKNPVESLILVECDRIVEASGQQALAQELSQVLADVRSTVQDWRAILDRVEAVGLAAEKSSLSAASRQEGI